MLSTSSILITVRRSIAARNDDLHILTVFPTVLGEGVRPFGVSGPPVGLRLIGTTMFRSGVALLTYQPEVA